jgi:hypothetical protein
MFAFGGWSMPSSMSTSAGGGHAKPCTSDTRWVELSHQDSNEHCRNSAYPLVGTACITEGCCALWSAATVGLRVRNAGSIGKNLRTQRSFYSLLPT